MSNTDEVSIRNTFYRTHNKATTRNWICNIVNTFHKQGLTTFNYFGKEPRIGTEARGSQPPLTFLL